MAFTSKDNDAGAKQLRSSANALAGTQGSKGFTSVNPVQKKEDSIQRVEGLEEEELDIASLKADPAQMMDLDEEDLG